MDFKLFLGVLKRYKRMVIGGAVFAILLSVLSYGTPGLKGGKPTIIPRGSELWEGDAELLISEAGFPYGRAVQQVQPANGTTTPSEPIGDFNYMASLSSVYAALANGNSVQHRAATEAGVPLCPSTRPCGTVVAAEVDDLSDSVPLPMVTVTSSGPTAADAARLAGSTISVLQNEVTRQEAAADTPVDQRVELQTVKSGTPATLTQGYSKSIPILVLFAIMSATVALAFIRNNHSEDPVRPTRRRLDEGLTADHGTMSNGAGSRIAEPEHGWAHARGGRLQLLGRRKAESGGPRPAKDDSGTAQRVTAQESSETTVRRQIWVDRTQPRLTRTPGFEPESHD